MPGSLQVVSGSGAGAKTDAAGDDQAEYDAASRTVQFRVGAGANATAGGVLAPGVSTTVRFDATVTDAAGGTTVTNEAALDYVAQTVGSPFTYRLRPVSTPGRGDRQPRDHQDRLARSVPGRWQRRVHHERRQQRTERRPRRGGHRPDPGGHHGDLGDIDSGLLRLRDRSGELHDRNPGLGGRAPRSSSTGRTDPGSTAASVTDIATVTSTTRTPISATTPPERQRSSPRPPTSP